MKLENSQENVIQKRWSYGSLVHDRQTTTEQTSDVRRCEEKAVRIDLVESKRMNQSEQGAHFRQFARQEALDPAEWMRPRNTSLFDRGSYGQRARSDAQ